jgi:hypothetical protein
MTWEEDEHGISRPVCVVCSEMSSLQIELMKSDWGTI